MGKLKTYWYLLGLLVRGYREENINKEQYLLQVLRTTNNPELFKQICVILQHAGSLFCIPTLMAYSRNESYKGLSSVDAIEGIKRRVIKEELAELEAFFTYEYWQPTWIVPKEKFISYVACLSGILSKEHLFDKDVMQYMATALLREIKINLTPYHSFKELFLCTPDWDAGEDVKRVLADVNDDLVIGNALAETTITIHPDRQLEENLLNMRADFLLTRLNLNVDYAEFHYLLKAASVLNRR
ncbi:hypothetical protein ABDD95_20380 [Mucilaginibacter sp. PAMB04274]|uniref:hypothetical protein n=1 Tax=Mucilaginibacter sp. PAMB04274 TaxID=3138568 RepID=UPI0031F6F17C